MATTWIKPIHRGGGIAVALGRSADYITDSVKTNDGELVDSYGCHPQTAQAEFLLSKKLYAQRTGRDQGKNDVIAYHIRMSFKPGEVTAEQALELGRELAARWTRGKHQYIVTAHNNTKNPHVHIIYNSVNLDCDRKYQDFLHSYKALRRVSDQLCLEYGLSVIENPDFSKGFNREEYLASRDGEEGNKPPSIRDILRNIIDTHLIPGTTFEDFIAAMQSAGCEVKQGKHLAFKIPGGKRFIRCNSLGDDYVEGALRERLAEKRVVVPRVTATEPTFESEPQAIPSSPDVFSPLPESELEAELPAISPTPETFSPRTTTPPRQNQDTPTRPAIQKPNLLIDIQSKMQQGYGVGFENFAKRQNLKDMAKTLLLLQDWGLDNYDALSEKADAVSKSFNDRSGRIKEIETRQKDINDLQINIGTYRKTKDKLAEYNRLKTIKTPPPKPSLFSKTTPKTPAEIYYAENESAINRCLAAKKYFDGQGLKILPTIKSLQTEYATLETEKKKLWSGHKAEREEMIALRTAKNNVDMFLGEPTSKKKSYDRDSR